jgi:GntR family transcriptional regulator/MocR family aminotransferase
LAPGEDDLAIAARMAGLGLETPALSRYAVTKLHQGGLMLGYAAYTPHAIRRGVERLAEALT